MSTWRDGADLRAVTVGQRVTKATGTLAAETKTLFTVTGGLVLVTSIIGYVTTVITVANSYKLQANPTVGTTADLCAATDIGTTDTPAGNVISWTGTKTDSLVSGPGAGAGFQRPIAIYTGTIEHVSAGTDGAITWYINYIPLDDGAAITAA